MLDVDWEAPTVTLSGTAITGVEPHLLARALAPGRIEDLPTEVKLGRRPLLARPQALTFGHYLDEETAAINLPVSTSYRAKAAASIARMYMNQQLGCCVVSAVAHMFGVWTGNDAQAGVALATDPEIQQQYVSWCGPGDRGCNITSVLNIVKSRGMTMNGVIHKIEGYVGCDWTNQLQTKAAIYLFGPGNIGFDLPQAWLSSAVWDVTTSRTVGGHSVVPLDYDETGVYVSSWGRIYRITWPAWMSRRWISEYYALLGVDWWNDDELAPNGVNVKELRADAILIGGGTLPPVTPPSPPVPPIPPVPAQGDFIISEQSVNPADGKRKIVLIQTMRTPDWQTEDGSVRLYCADCLEVLPELEGVDAVVTDPPYGIGERMQGGTWGAHEKYADFRRWDVAPTADVLARVRSKARNVILWGANYFDAPSARCWLVWDKSNAVPTMADVELAWTNLDRPAKRFRGQVGIHEWGHPTEKPLNLMLWCIEQLPLPCETILDPFMGAGTTGVAAVMAGRKFVGVEIVPKYFDICVKRIKAELERFPLLEAAPKIKQREMSIVS